MAHRHVDESRRKQTPDDRWKLSPQQEQACDLLATGATVTDAATAVNVTRQTVSEWLNHHAGFQAALNTRRQELWSRCVDRLRAMLPKALDRIEDELDGEHGLKAAEMILKTCGMLGESHKPTGQTDPQEIEADQADRELLKLMRP